MCPVPPPPVQTNPSAQESQKRQGEAKMNSRKEVSVWKNTKDKTNIFEPSFSTSLLCVLIPLRQFGPRKNSVCLGKKYS